MTDAERENLRQLFLDFIDTQPDDEWDDTDAWKRYLQTYDDLLAEVERLQKELEESKENEENIEVHLTDNSGGGSPDIQCVVTNAHDGTFITIEATGWSDFHCGPPIVIENYEGELILMVWADINQEDYTHKINLRGALDSKCDIPDCSHHDDN